MNVGDVVLHNNTGSKGIVLSLYYNIYGELCIKIRSVTGTILYGSYKQFAKLYI